MFAGLVKFPNMQEWTAIGLGVFALPWVSKIAVSFLPETFQMPAAQIAVETIVGLGVAFAARKFAGHAAGDAVSLIVFFRLTQRLAGLLTAGKFGTLAEVDYADVGEDPALGADTNLGADTSLGMRADGGSMGVGAPVLGAMGRTV